MHEDNADLRAFEGLVDDLHQFGLAMLPGHLAGARLDQAKTDFEAMMNAVGADPDVSRRDTPLAPGQENRQYKYLVDDINEAANRITTTAPFLHSPLLVEVALDGLVRRIARSYFGDEIVLQNADATRLYPMSPRDFDAFQWHHDGRGTKLNAMILLSDVTHADQAMTYLTGSHKIERDLLSDNNHSAAEIDELSAADLALEPVACTGSAGTVIIFDANGLHRGNRSMGAVRDTLMVRYLTDSAHCWEIEVPELTVDALPEEQQAFLRRQLRVLISSGAEIASRRESRNQIESERRVRDREHAARTERFGAWLDRHVAFGEPIILLDDGQLGRTALPARPVALFPERDGVWWGPPETDADALTALAALGANRRRYLVVAWPAFWWQEYYAGFFASLREQCVSVVAGEDAIVIELPATS